MKSSTAQRVQSPPQTFTEKRLSPTKLKSIRPIDLSSSQIKKTIHVSSKTYLRRFIGVVKNREDALGILECMFLVNLLKKRHLHVFASVVIHNDNKQLVASTRLFDKIHIYQADKSLRKIIQTANPDILYIPYKDFHTHLITSFSGSRVRTTGFGKNILSKHIFRLRQISSQKDLHSLQKYGYDLKPETAMPQIRKKLEISSLSLPRTDYIWLSLFDANDVGRFWPIAYITRLARLLQKIEVNIVVPIPTTLSIKNTSRLEKSDLTRKAKAQIQFLKENTPANVYLLLGASPEQRSAGMQRARAVVALSGPELALAAMLRCPLVIIHDMRSHKIYAPSKNQSQSKDSTSELANKSKHNGMQKETNILYNNLVFWQQLVGQDSQKELVRYIHSSHIEQRHITPSVPTCINNCYRCQYNACIEYISPEQVFENLKHILCPS